MTSSVNSVNSLRPVCTLEDVEKLYGSLRALGPLSLQLFPGELVGLRGANGAGKSTLLKVLAGLLKPDRGRRTLQPEARRGVSYLPQDVALYGGMTALENLRFWGAVYGLPLRAARSRSLWLLDRLALSEKARTPAHALSGGMLRRLHLASALMISPQLLLLDEPTVGADPRSAELILSLTEHFRARGASIVLVSHHPGELERVCTRILTLEAGRLVPPEGEG